MRQAAGVQKLTDAAVANVTRVGDYKGPADFGTKVHKEIADAIRKERTTPTSGPKNR